MQNSTDQIADEILVMDAQGGRGDAFETLVSRWQRRLWWHAFNLTGHTEAAWDITQESWLNIVRDFYNRKLLSSVILVWIVGIVFAGLAVYSAIQFFQTDQTKWQIAYAALFIVGVHEVGVIKIFAWQMAHRHNLKRDLKRLELRVVELNETLKGSKIT